MLEGRLRPSRIVRWTIHYYFTVRSNEWMFHLYRCCCSACGLDLYFMKIPLKHWSTSIQLLRMRAIADAASDMDVEHLCAGLSAFMPLMLEGWLMIYILSSEKLLQEIRSNQQHYWCWHHICTGTHRAGTAWHGVFSNLFACTFWALPEWEPSTCTHGDTKDETWLYKQTDVATAEQPEIIWNSPQKVSRTQAAAGKL